MPIKPKIMEKIKSLLLKEVTIVTFFVWLFLF